MRMWKVEYQKSCLLELKSFMYRFPLKTYENICISLQSSWWLRTDSNNTSQKIINKLKRIQWFIWLKERDGFKSELVLRTLGISKTFSLGSCFRWVLWWREVAYITHIFFQCQHTYLRTSLCMDSSDATIFFNIHSITWN